MADEDRTRRLSLGRIWIAGKPWTVFAQEAPALTTDEGVIVAGECDMEDQEILINTQCKPAAQAAGLCHELAHVFELSATRQHNDGEEECARAIGDVGLCSLFGDPRNDWIIEWIQERLQGA